MSFWRSWPFWHRAHGFLFWQSNLNCPLSVRVFPHKWQHKNDHIQIFWDIIYHPQPCAPDKQNIHNILCVYNRVWHPGPGNSRSREFCSFLDGTGTGTGKNWSRKKVPVPVPEKFGPGKKYRYRYRKNLVPEKSTGPGTGKNWSRKKVPVPVSEKIGPGTVEFPGTPGHCIF